VVLDIGANIGAHTLLFARRVGDRGRVVAFEPTAFAFGKLQRNLAINPSLSSRVIAVQAMLVADEGKHIAPAIYSSWPLVGAKGLHAVHRGQLQETLGARSIKLDIAVSEIGLTAVDHIKLDVDGNEPEVILGGMGILAQFHPIIYLELAPYLYRETPKRLEQMIADLLGLGYRFYFERNGHPLPTDVESIVRLAPSGGSINVVARVRQA